MTERVEPVAGSMAQNPPPRAGSPTTTASAPPRRAVRGDTGDAATDSDPDGSITLKASPLALVWLIARLTLDTPAVAGSTARDRANVNSVSSADWRAPYQTCQAAASVAGSANTNETPSSAKSMVMAVA